MKVLLVTLLGIAFWAPLGISQSLTIYCENDPPNQILNSDGSLGGLFIDVVREIQRRVGNTDPVQMVPWARGYAALLNQPNVVLFSMTRTAERNPQFGWIGPVKETRHGFFVKSGSSAVINSLEDAKRLGSIGVYRDDVKDQILTSEGFTNLDRANGNVQNVKKLMLGRIDAYATAVDSVTDEVTAAGYKAGDVKLAFVFMKPQLFIATSKVMPAGMVQAWNEALGKMKADGTLRKMLSKYYPGAPMPGPTEFQ